MSFPERVLVFGGGYGVFVFFALTGYLLYRPFARGGPIDLRRYALNRALRILPLYYVVLVTLLVLGADGNLLVFATFSENFSTETIFGVDAPMWSLVIEVHFYLLLPFIALVAGRRAVLVLGGLAAASLVVRLVAFGMDPGAARTLLVYSLPAMFFFFVGGMLLAEWEPKIRQGPPAGLLLAVAAALWLLACWQPRLDPLMAVSSACVVAAVVLSRLPLGWRPLALLGTASYSLYLWHLPLIEAIGSAEWSFLGLLAVAGPVCVAVAFVSYRLVEEPFLRLRTRWASPR